MFAYFAFKALKGRYPDALRSAQRGTLWEIHPAIGLPCLKAAEETFEDGHGVYAATIEEAQRYAEWDGGDVYLVAPLPGGRAVVGEAGWRAEAAICLAQVKHENRATIARLILTAVEHGLPQSPAIVLWAISVLSQAEGKLVRPSNVDLCDLLRRNLPVNWSGELLPYLDQADDKLQIARKLIESCNKLNLVNLNSMRWAILTVARSGEELAMPSEIPFRQAVGLNYMSDEEKSAWLGRLLRCLDDNRFSRLCEALLGQKDPETLHDLREAWLACADLPVDPLTEEMDHPSAWRILALAKAQGVSKCPHTLLEKALAFIVQRGDFGWIYHLGLYCDDEMWGQTIRRALLAASVLKLLYMAGRDWPQACYHEEIAKAVIAAKNAEYLYLAGRYWPEGRFIQAIAEALSKTGNAEYLYLAGRDWPEGRYCEAIADALIETRDAAYLYQAGNYWLDERFSAKITKALIETRDAKYLYLAGRDWPAGRYSADIGLALAKTRDEDYRYRAGCDWPVDRLDAKLVRALLRGMSAEYLFYVGRDWPRGILGKEIAQALARRNQPEYLYRAGRDWPDDRFSNVITRALIRAGDAYTMYLAGRDWPDERFSSAITEALVKAQNSYDLYLAGKDWPEGRFSERITQALIKTRDAELLFLAGRDWPEGRFDPAITQALIETRKARWLYLAGLDWQEERYTPQIAQALAETNNAEYLYLAGLHWPDGRYTDEMLRALIRTGDPKCIQLAMRDWRAERSEALMAALWERSHAHSMA